MNKKEVEDALQEVPRLENVEERKKEEKEEIIDRPYTLRKLKDKDLFPMLKILKKIKIKDYKKAFFQTTIKGTPALSLNEETGEGADEETSKETDSDNALKQIGIMTAFDMADILIENLPNVLNEAYELWSDLSGIPVEEIKDMEFGTLPLMIMDTFSEARNTSFFKVLSKFLS